jgi:spore maturation protein CgeB
MNISIFGSSLVSAYWNGAATYYRGIIRALHELGHRITFYEPNAYGRQQHRDISDPEWARVVVYSADEEGVLRALESAKDADFLMKTSGVGVFDGLLESAILEVKSRLSAAVFWDVDAPATLDRINADPSDSFRQLLTQYDLILTYGGGDPVVSAYRQLGAAECVPIYNALDPDTHYPVPSEPRFECDLALLANRLPDREARVEEFFFGVAEKLPHKRFILGGSGWGDRRLPSNVAYLGHIYTRDHNAFNCSPTAVLNVNRESMARYGFSPPTRIFEAVGAASCLITDEWSGIEMFLKPEAEVLVARDGEQVAEYVLALGKDRAEKIGGAARLRVLSDHTYDHRARQVQSVLEGKVTSALLSSTRSAKTLAPELSSL